jgi:hypothetical protein
MYRILTSPLSVPRIGLLSAREEHGQNRVLRGVLGGQGKCIMGSFIVVLFAESSYGDQIAERSV